MIQREAHARVHELPNFVMIELALVCHALLVTKLNHQVGCLLHLKPLGKVCVRELRLAEGDPPCHQRSRFRCARLNTINELWLMLERSRAVEVDGEGLGERGGLRLVREEDRVRL